MSTKRSMSRAVVLAGGQRHLERRTRKATRALDRLDDQLLVDDANFAAHRNFVASATAAGVADATDVAYLHDNLVRVVAGDPGKAHLVGPIETAVVSAIVADLRETLEG